MITLKTSLHLHTQEDPEDGAIIKYSAKALIDQAAQLDFKVLAITWHNRFFINPEITAYAKTKNIIILPGIEMSIKKNSFHHVHVLIINPDSTPDIKTMEELRIWKKSHPEALIIAPHPNFPVQSLGLKTLKREADIFDAIEHSWFYTRKFNQNRATQKLAKELDKTFVATSDLHDLQFLKDDYCLIEAQTNSPADIITAIKQGRLTNVSRPKKILELITFVWSFMKPRAGKKL